MLNLYNLLKKSVRVKISPILILLIVVICGLSLSSLLIYYSSSRNTPVSYATIAASASVPDKSVPTSLSSTDKPNNKVTGLPVKISIPAINVSATIESVGLTSHGAVGVPKNPVDAAWYNLGPRPGEIGESVIDGHYGWYKDGVSAVFNNLDKLSQGDKVSVVDGAGVSYTFVVSRLKTYSQNEAVSSVFNSSDGKAHLNLITCTGAWNETSQSYPERLVVFTDEQLFTL